MEGLSPFFGCLERSTASVPPKHMTKRRMFPFLLPRPVATVCGVESAEKPILVDRSEE